MNIKLKLVKLIKYVFPRYGLKKSDIILATFPKSGTTWFRFIYANLISILELEGRFVDYEFLNNDLNSAFDAHIYPKIKYTKLPRLVATHQEYDKRKFRKNKTLFLYRNPLDTMVSYWEYRRGSVQFNNDYTFKSFIRDSNYGIEAWIKYYKKWIKEADLSISYEDLKNDDIHTVQKVLTYFSIDIDENKTIVEAVKRSRFDKIRKMEEESGLDAKAKKSLKKTFKFARKGKIGEWEVYFDNDDLDFSNKSFKTYQLDSFIIKNS